MQPLTKSLFNLPIRNPTITIFKKVLKSFLCVQQQQGHHFTLPQAGLTLVRCFGQFPCRCFLKIKCKKSAYIMRQCSTTRRLHSLHSAFKYLHGFNPHSKWWDYHFADEKTSAERLCDFFPRS